MSAGVFSAGGACLIGHLETARAPFERMRGLLGRTGLPPGTGLLIEPCSSIHTFGMRFPIDAIFLDAGRRVTRIHRNLGPARIAFGGKGAALVIEVQSGWLAPDAVAPGDTLSFGPAGASPEL